jgi:hypothetical protein
MLPGNEKAPGVNSILGLENKITSLFEVLQYVLNNINNTWYVAISSCYCYTLS